MINLGIGNYRGNLHIKEGKGRYYWVVQCDMDNSDEWDWAEIPEHLYNALALFKESEKETRR